MTITSPAGSSRLKIELYDIMNSRTNGVQAVYDKQVLIKQLFNNNLNDKTYEKLYAEFKTILATYVKEHIKQYGFFNYESFFFLDLIQAPQ